MMHSTGTTVSRYRLKSEAMKAYCTFLEEAPFTSLREYSKLLMLTALFDAAVEERRLLVKDAVAASRQRTTSALRTLKNLESEGLIVRHAHFSDGRSNLVTLTEKGISILDRMAVELLRFREQPHIQQ